MSTKTDLDKAAREFAELEFLRTHESSISPITIGFNNLRPDKVFSYAAIKGFKAGYEHAQTTVSEGFFLTKEELEQRDKAIAERAFEAGRRRGHFEIVENNERAAYTWEELQDGIPNFKDYWQQVKGQG